MRSKSEYNQMLTTGQIAEICGVHFRTVGRWIDRGDLKGFHLPGRGDRRVKASDLIGFMKQQGMPAPSDDAFSGLSKAVKNKILIVDDDPHIVNAFARILRQNGYEIETAHDGFSAGMILSQFRPHLMILDLRMPKMDGFEVIQQIKKANGVNNPKILVVSGESEEGLKRALELGAEKVLSKPTLNEALLNAVEGLIQK